MSPENVDCIIMCTDIKDKIYGVMQAKKYIFDFKTASKYCLENLWGNHFAEKLNKLNIFLSIVDKERIIDRNTFEKIKK